MRPLTRVIDSTIHHLTAPQMLERLLRLFGESRTQPVIIASFAGEGDRIQKMIRVELSRAKKKSEQAGVEPVNFGLRANKMDITTKTHGRVIEYWQLDFRITPKQRFAYLAKTINAEELSI